MSLHNLKPEIQRLLAITIPAAVLLFAAILIVPRVVGIRRVGLEVAEQRIQLEEAKRRSAMEKAAQHGKHRATVPQSRNEQLVFLKQLSRMVADSRVELVSYRPPSISTTSTAAKPSEGKGAPVKPIAIEVTVSGPYGNLLHLFQSLKNADRLFTVERLQVRTETYPRLTANFRLVRYVTLADATISPAAIR